VIAAIVLAAGLSRRMGRPKLLLELGGKPIVRWSVEALVPLVDDVVVVTGPDDGGIRHALAGLRIRIAVNPRPPEGQGASIAAGVAALRPWTRAVLVALGDQPRVPADVVPALLAAWERTGKSIVAPVYRGTQGTPVLFAGDTLAELGRLTGDAGARGVIIHHRDRAEFVAFDHPMPPDVDTPEDYTRLHVE
jgi:molybdenum cofactor cytidylyltransferase